MKTKIFLIFFMVITLISCSSPEEKKVKHMQRGLKYYNDSKYNEAIIEFKNALQITPRDGDAHYRLGLAYIKSVKIQNIQNAYKEFNQAVELNPDTMDAHCIGIKF